MRDRRFVAVHRGGPLKISKHRLLAVWAANCAEHVLPVFTEGSSDDRPRRAIEMTRAWARGEVSVGDARKAAVAAHAAAREATSKSASAVARAAGHAVATAHMADHSLGATIYALKAIEAKGASTDAERAWQIAQLPDEIRELVVSALRRRFRERGNRPSDHRSAVRDQLRNEGHRQRAIHEDVGVAPYDSRWPELFQREAKHLRLCIPAGLIRRIEHFGSTAVPGLAAKPIVDMLVEVSSLGAARTEIAPILQSEGYDYFWRPTFGDDVPPWYAFFIKRAKNGVRTHHIHMVSRRRMFQEHWDRVLFRDYLIAHAETARAYEKLKTELAAAYPNDRVAYTKGKTAFIQRITAQAKKSK
jgi:GrpB-like predicted nucleotidyltransferase (UPF0157 family)